MSIKTRYWLLVLFLLLAACSTAEDPIIPTEITLPTVTPTYTPEPTAVPSPTRIPEAIAPQTIADDPADQSAVRVVHAAPDTPTFDVYIEQLAIATNVSFGLATGRANIVGGDYHLSIVPTGNDYFEEPLFEQDITIARGQTSLLLVTGTPDALTAQLIPEPSAPLIGTESRLTFIHAIPNGPPYVVIDRGASITSTLNFGQVSTSVEMMTQDVFLTFQSGETPLHSDVYTLIGGNNHTFVLTGIANDPDSWQVLEFSSPAPSIVNLRLIHAAPGTPTVDVYVNGQAFSTNLGYGRSSGWQQQPLAAYNIDIYAAGADPASTSPLYRQTIRGNPDENLSLVFMGEGTNMQIVSHRERLSPTPPDEARVVFVNSLQDLPRVRLEMAGGPELSVADLRYGDVSEPVLLSANVPITIIWSGVQSDGALGDAVDLSSNLIFEPGRTYFYVISRQIETGPIIFSESVGVGPAEPDDDEEVVEEPTPEPVGPTQVRLINAFNHPNTVNFYIDGITIGQDLPYRGSTALVIIPQGRHIIRAELVGVEGIVVESELTFPETSTSTIVAYGVGGLTEIQLVRAQDSALYTDPTATTIRFFNLSPTLIETAFGVAYAPPTVSAGEPSPVDGYRMPFSFGIERVVDDIPSGRFSEPVIMPFGTYNILVIDSARESIAWLAASVVIEQGGHIDVLAMEDQQSMRVDAFIVPYP